MRKIAINTRHLMNMAMAIAVALLTTGCMEEVTHIAKVDEKLVVFSFISPDDTVRVNVTKSYPLYLGKVVPWGEEQFPPLSGATVTLRELTSGNEVSVPWNEQEKAYMLLPNAFSVKAGEEYELQVSAPNLPSVVARTIVPLSKPNMVTCRIDTIVDKYNGYPKLAVMGEIMDFEGEDNYYSFELMAYDGYCDSDGILELFELMHYKTIFSDEGHDGELLSYVSSGFYLNTYLVQAAFMHVDKNYYEYHKTLNDYSDYFNPFAEPIIIHGNMEGGIGVFGSFNTYIQEWTFDDNLYYFS